MHMLSFAGDCCLGQWYCFCNCQVAVVVRWQVWLIELVAEIKCAFSGVRERLYMRISSLQETNILAFQELVAGATR